MAYLLSLVILTCSFNIGILEVSAAIESVVTVTKPSTNANGGDRLSTATPKKIHHPLPPVAMPGILKSFEPSLVPRGRHELLTELRFLKNNMLPLEKPLMRRRRSAGIQKPLHRSQVPAKDGRRAVRKDQVTSLETSNGPEVTAEKGSRKTRDLRRLRRDLGYNTQPYPALDEFSQPPYVISTKPHHQSPQYQRPTVPVRTPELSRLLRGLDFLEQLALLTQAREVPPVPEPRRPLHAPPSRFAPQPKLFEDEDIPQARLLRTEAPLVWKDPQERNMYKWRPEKRWMGSSGWRGVSMVPGVKRSVFRETSLDQHHPRRFGIDRGKMIHSGYNDLSSLAAILGTEIDPDENRIRRAAM